jgi:1-deoxy-D-xylulose-5-phosphate synthase
VDGHNLKSLIEVFKRAKIHNSPVLVHVLTKKGKGYLPAEENPDKFHGIGPFDIESGNTLGETGPPSYTEIFGDTLVSLAATDPKVLAITAAMPTGTGLSKFAEQYPNRFFDVGIAEQHGVTMAAGLATAGYRPVVAIYSSFLQRAYDQVLHDVCLQKLPVLFAIDRAGLVGEDGPTHHGLFDISYLGSIPNLVYMAPADERELQYMLATALRHNGPTAIRYPRGAGVGCPLAEDWKSLPVGLGEVRREGADLTLLAVGSMVHRAEQTAELLEEQEIYATVINARFIKPLDQELIVKFAKSTGNVYTMEEHVLTNGFGSAVLALLNDKGLKDTFVYRFGLPDSFIEQGSITQLLEKYGLDPVTMAEVIAHKHSLARKGRKTGLYYLRARR